MPRNINTKGMAITNRGFITLSLYRLLIPVDFGRGRGVKTGKPFGMKPEPKSMPMLNSCGPVFYLLRAFKTEA